MNIIILKLVSSEEIVCELVNQDEEKITVKNPVYLVVDPQTKQAAFHPFIMSSNIHENGGKSISFLRKNLLLSILEPSEQTNLMYQQVFSKIVTPPSSIIQ